MKTKHGHHERHTGHVAKRVIHICILYLLALTTAVACGKSFEAKSLNDLQAAISFSNPGSSSSFIPQINQVNFVDQGMNTHSLDLSLVDGARSVYGIFGYGQSEFQGEVYEEGFNYRMDAACSKNGCSTIVVLLTRTEDINKQTVQNTYVFNTSTSPISRVNAYQGTQYTSTSQALQTLGL